MKKIFSILLFAFVLRIIAANQSLWLDEAINVRATSTKTVVELVTDYSLADFHPPIYHVILHYWIGLFGYSEISVRMPSILFGLITIFFVYKISELFFGSDDLNLKPYTSKFNIIPPILLASSSLHVYYSSEARMYSLAAMGISASIYFMMKLLGDSNPFSKINSLFKNKKITYFLKLPTKSDLHSRSYQKASILFIIFTCIAIYSDYLTWFMLPVFLLLLPAQTLISLLAIIPWLPYFIKQLNIGTATATQFPLWSQVVGGLSPKTIALIPIKFLIGRVSIDNNTIYLAVLIPLLLLTTYLFFKSTKHIIKHKEKNLLIIFSWFFTPLVIGILIAFKISVLSYFRLLFILPAFYLILTHGLSKINNRYKTGVFLLLFTVNIITTGIYIFIPKFHKEDWRGLVEYINETPADKALVLIPSIAQADPYLYYEQDIQIADRINFELTSPPTTIYLLRYVQEIFDPEDKLRTQIENIGYQKTSEKTFNGVVVWIYSYTGNTFALNLKN